MNSLAGSGGLPDAGGKEGFGSVVCLIIKNLKNWYWFKEPQKKNLEKPFQTAEGGFSLGFPTPLG